MNCPKCGNTMTPNMKFCAKCGTPVAPVNKQQPATSVQPIQSQINAQQKPPVNLQSKQLVQNQAQPPKKAKKNKSGKKNNLVLKIIAIILVIAVLASGGLLLADNLMYKNEVKADEYITDFPVLKQKTDFLVYNTEKFPSTNYKIKVERLLNGGILKSEALRKTETIIDDKSTEPVYSIDFKEDGNYRIILEDISAVRTQPVTSTTQTDESATKRNETAETIVIDVKVDNDDREAIDKVDINSKPGDKPIELPSGSSSSIFIEATDKDFEKFESWATCSIFNSYAYKDFDCKTASTQFIIDEMILPHYIGGYEFYFGEATFLHSAEDPLSKFSKVGFWKIPEENVKWICENIYNIKYEAVTEDVVNESGMRYLHDGFFYQRDPAFGDAGWDEADVKKYDIVDGKYEIILENYSCYEDWETGDTVRELMKTAKVTAEIKIIDGEKYWSIYKIENYDPNEDSSNSTSKDMYSENVALYNEFLKNGGWNEYIDMWEENDRGIKSCIIDINEDGIYELVLHLTDSEYSYFGGKYSLLYGIKNGEVVLLEEAFETGGTVGGDIIEVKYDNLKKKHVAVIYEHGRDGFMVGFHSYEEFDYDGGSITNRKKYGIESYDHTGQSDLYADKIAKIKGETSLYVIENDRLLIHKLNDSYISKEEFEKNNENRFVDPTDSKYQMKVGSMSNPIGL